MRPKNNSNELKLTRIYDASVKAVWEAWTDPKKVAKWWGPRGFSITTKSKDLRPGGKWIYTMHGPDGVDYPNVTTYHVVEPMKRIEYDHGANDEHEALFHVTVVFTENKGKTRMEMTMRLESPEAAQQIADFIKMAGGNSTWDRLGEFIDEECNDKQVFILNRAFETPIEKIFEALTTPHLLEKWMPPVGLSMKILQGEIKSGESVFYVMSAEEEKFYGRSTYREIRHPELISFQQEFCDEAGRNAKHPGASVWPTTWLTTMALIMEDKETTRMTLKSEIIGSATSEEMLAFVKERAGMTKGWNSSLDCLEELLEKG